MSENLGHVEHGEGAAKCVHRVVSATKTHLEVVYPCSGHARFVVSFTVTVSRSLLRSNRFGFGDLEGTARYVAAERAERSSETPAHRAARLTAQREQSAREFERDAAARLDLLSDQSRARYRPLVAALAQLIRSGQRGASKKARSALLDEISLQGFRDEVFPRHRSRAARTEAPARPWFAEALALPSWPCDAQAIKRAFAARALATHPDHGGTSAAFIEVKRARDEALCSVEARAV